MKRNSLFNALKNRAVKVAYDEAEVQNANPLVVQNANPLVVQNANPVIPQSIQNEDVL